MSSAMPAMPAAPPDISVRQPKPAQKLDAMERLDFTQSKDLANIDEYGRIKA
jgi:hypothetical protein